MQNIEGTKVQGKGELEYESQDYQYCGGLYC